MIHPALQPATTLESIFGSGFVFAARSSPHAGHWLPQDEIGLDMITAGMLLVLGDMPVVCAASVSTSEALNLLRDAGMLIPRDIHRYYDTAEYLQILQKLRSDGSRMVVQHVHPLSEIPLERCWVAPSVLSFVNNKANLEYLVPKGHIPAREIIPMDQVACLNRSWNAPIVIKAVTDESTGGGLDVRICRSVSDIQKAAEYFKSCRHVVIEEYMDIRQNLCLHYCVTADGRIDYLGFAEQVSDENGIYCGNWIETESDCIAEAVEVGASIVHAAFERGYYGILGMDMAVLEDGHCKVFDLNFRGNGSTPAVLYSQSIYKNYGKPVIRLRRLKGRSSYRDMLDAVYQAMSKKILLPLGSCDPGAGPYAGKRPLLNGMILGRTRQEVEENESELTFMGFDI
jgi:hypothetical protein